MSPRPRGRPPSPQTRQAIREAAAELIAELGYDGTSVESIAVRAKAGKQTIYRLWGSKVGLVADLVRNGLLALPAVPVADTGDLTADLLDWHVRFLPVAADHATASIIRALLVEQSSAPVTASVDASRLLTPSLLSLRSRLDKAKERGEVRPDADLVAVEELLVGAHALAFLHLAPLNLERVEAWLDALSRGLIPRSPPAAE
ncbi:MAG: TetR/AcrR family transcriptional regulator [Bifidobacteriaceae bacterium]|jgi:AcrR family transcriptional regulator|nr:TetR/AcrR family transcriptional regulator [Bifidobacteriaceae bacterium]